MYRALRVVSRISVMGDLQEPKVLKKNIKVSRRIKRGEMDVFRGLKANLFEKNPKWADKMDRCPILLRCARGSSPLNEFLALDFFINRQCKIMYDTQVLVLGG